jgi:hypothetical protein
MDFPEVEVVEHGENDFEDHEDDHHHDEGSDEWDDLLGAESEGKVYDSSELHD